MAARTFVASYDDKKALKAFAESVDAVTYEFENIPLETVRFIQTIRPVYPDDRLLDIAQDRLKEKKFLNDIGIETARWAPVHTAKDIEKSAEALGCDGFILKMARFGYDGKGQISVSRDDQDKRRLWKDLKTDSAILEETIDFACEISTIIARDKLGQTAIYGPMLN